MTSILRHKEPKGDHYNAQLTHALLKGNWADATAGNAPNGTALSWAELFRKWGKHTGGNTALLHHLRDISLLYLSSRSMASSTYINLAANPETPQNSQAGASAPGSSSSNEGTTTTSASNSSFVHVPHPHRHKARTSEINPTASSSRGTSVVRQTDGRASFLSTGDLDGDDVNDNGTWAENGPWWSAVASENLDEVKEGIQAIERSIKEDKLSAGELTSAKAILVYHHFSIGEHVEAIRVAEELETIRDVRVGIVHGDVGVLDRIRMRCLKGMSLELSGGDSHTAIQAYLSTLPLLDSFESFIRPTPSYIAQEASSSKGKFDAHQEVYRCLSTALSRAAILSSRTTDVTRSLRILRTYHSFSSSWPHTFRPVQHQRMLLLYLRALQAGYPAPNTACATPYLVDIGSSQAPGRQVWKNEVLETFRQGQQLLSSTTIFPRAGTLNLPVRRFTESCVALADIHAPFAKEVVAILYWAMTLTFQSQSLLRHLTRLLVASGSYADAKRNFELYVKIVLKDRETKQPEISLQLKRRPTVGEAAHPDELARQVEEAEDESGPEAEERKSQFAEAESDTTPEFISTLLVGSRLLLKNLGEVEEAWRYAGLAGKMISVTDQRKEHIPRDLRAEVEACKGIVRMAMAMSSVMPDVDASNRAEYQSQAIDFLTTATLLSTKSSQAFYHLSYCLAEARQIEPAITAVRTCLELDQQNVQAWHLLALLLSASKDWEGATKACEAGVGIWEEDEENDAAETEESPTGNPDENEPKVGSKDFASPTTTITQPTEPTSAAPIILRSGAIRFPAPLSAVPPTRSKKLENVIRLRITYKSIVEKTQGAEPAMEEAENLFAFFSARSGSGRANFGYRRGLSGVMGQSMISVKDTGGSYVSVADLQNAMLDNPGHRTSMISIQAPEGEGGATEELSELQLSNTTSPDEISTHAPETTEMSEKEKAGSIGHSPLHRKMLASHLHIPGSRQGSTPKPNSVRRLGTGAASTPDLSLPRDRTMSVGSTATPSLAPTGAGTLTNTYAPSRPTSPPPVGSDHGRTSTESRILSGLWLQSAATYRRWGKVDQCLVSIQEAEIIDPENPDVWVQLGLLHRTTSPHSPHLAISALTKSVLLRPDYTPSIVSLSKVYLETGQVELAHNLLFQLTQGGGWDVPEAWYYLGKACEEQARKDRARACFDYALELESTRPCRTWADAVDRWL